MFHTFHSSRHNHKIIALVIFNNVVVVVGRANDNCQCNSSKCLLHFFSRALLFFRLSFELALMQNEVYIAFATRVYYMYVFWYNMDCMHVLAFVHVLGNVSMRNYCYYWNVFWACISSKLCSCVYVCVWATVQPNRPTQQAPIHFHMEHIPIEMSHCTEHI